MITEALDDFYRLILWDFYILKLKKFYINSFIILS